MILKTDLSFSSHVKTVTKAAFTLHSSSDPISIFFSSHVAEIGYGQRLCKQEKVTLITIFSDRFQASFICGNKSDTNRICVFAPAV